MANLLCSLINLYVLIIFVRILLSWFPVRSGGPMATFQGLLHLVTEPVLGPMRRVLPVARVGGAAIDLSPLAVFFAAFLATRILCG